MSHCKHSHHSVPERLLKWYDFSQFNVMPLTMPILFPATATAMPAMITSITIKKINPDDRVNLEATIQWNAILTNAASTVAGNTIVGVQQATFQIWRDAPGTGVLVAQYTDSGTLAGISAGPNFSTVTTNSVTTTITATDHNVTPGHTHTYFLTVTIPATNAFVSLTTFGTTTSAPQVQEYHFAGFNIDENNT